MPTHVERQVPKIDGSSGGFIALVVCLSLLIVGLCIAVFIQLRNFEPTDEERTIRRQLGRRHRSNPSSLFAYTSSTTSPAQLTQKIASVFGIGTTENNGRKKMKKGSKSGRDWLQAPGEEWEADMNGTNVQTRSLSGLQNPHDTGEPRGIRLADHRSISKDDSPLHPPFQASQQSYSSSSNSSVQDIHNPFTRSSMTPSPLHIAVTRLQTENSFVPSESSPSLLSTTTRALTGSPDPYAIGSADDLHSQGERQVSQGTISTRTLHTGTKFIESLE